MASDEDRALVAFGEKWCRGVQNQGIPCPVCRLTREGWAREAKLIEASHDWAPRMMDLYGRIRASGKTIKRLREERDYAYNAMGMLDVVDKQDKLPRLKRKGARDGR